MELEGWSLLRPLGQGAMASVFLAEDDHGRRRALKAVECHQLALVARLELEAELLGRLEHRSLPAAHGLHRGQTHVWLELDAIDGAALHDAVLPIEQAAAVAAQLAELLAYLHQQGVAHRDVKPANLLLGPNGLYLVDFGAALLLNEGVRLTQQGEQSPASPRYAPPEWFATGQADPRQGDVFAFGVTVYELLAGPKSSGWQDLSEARRRGDPLDPGEEVDDALRAAVLEATLPEGAARPSMEDLARRLAPFAASLVPVPTQTPEALGRFVVGAVLGRGATATVYEAHDQRLGRQVALKVLHERPAPGSARALRFARETRAAARLQHRSIVRLFDAGVDTQGAWMAMERVSGATLADRLESGPLPAEEALDIAIALGEALAHAHEHGVVHRDVKPANVLIGDAGRVVLSDFGLARLTSDSLASLTRTGEVLGTLAYMAPEQALGKEAGTAADRFSLCAVIAECYQGRPPFSGTSAAAILRALLDAEPDLTDVPREVRAVLARSLGKTPSGRHGDTQALVEDLRRIRRGQRPAEGIGGLQRAARWLERRRRQVAAGAVVGLSLALAAWVGSGPWRQARQLETEALRRWQRLQPRLQAMSPAEAAVAFRAFVEDPELQGSQAVTASWRWRATSLQPGKEAFEARATAYVLGAADEDLQALLPLAWELGAYEALVRLARRLESSGQALTQAQSERVAEAELALAMSPRTGLSPVASTLAARLQTARHLQSNARISRVGETLLAVGDTTLSTLDAHLEPVLSQELEGLCGRPSMPFALEGHPTLVLDRIQADDRCGAELRWLTDAGWRGPLDLEVRLGPVRTPVPSTDGRVLVSPELWPDPVELSLRGWSMLRGSDARAADPWRTHGLASLDGARLALLRRAEQDVRLVDAAGNVLVRRRMRGAQALLGLSTVVAALTRDETATVHLLGGEDLTTVQSLTLDDPGEDAELSVLDLDGNGVDELLVSGALGTSLLFVEEDVWRSLALPRLEVLSVLDVDRDGRDEIQAILKGAAGTWLFGLPGAVPAAEVPAYGEDTPADDGWRRARLLAEVGLRAPALAGLRLAAQRQTRPAEARRAAREAAALAQSMGRLHEAWRLFEQGAELPEHLDEASAVATLAGDAEAALALAERAVEARSTPERLARRAGLEAWARRPLLELLGEGLHPDWIFITPGLTLDSDQRALRLHAVCHNRLARIPLRLADTVLQLSLGGRIERLEPDAGVEFHLRTDTDEGDYVVLAMQFLGTEDGRMARVVGPGGQEAFRWQWPVPNRNVQEPFSLGCVLEPSSRRLRCSLSHGDADAVAQMAEVGPGRSSGDFDLEIRPIVPGRIEGATLERGHWHDERMRLSRIAVSGTPRHQGYNDIERCERLLAEGRFGELETCRDRPGDRFARLQLWADRFGSRGQRALEHAETEDPDGFGALLLHEVRSGNAELVMQHRRDRGEHSEKLIDLYQGVPLPLADPPVDPLKVDLLTRVDWELETPVGSPILEEVRAEALLGRALAYEAKGDLGRALSSAQLAFEILEGIEQPRLAGQRLAAVSLVLARLLVQVGEVDSAVGPLTVAASREGTGQVVADALADDVRLASLRGHPGLAALFVE